MQNNMEVFINIGPDLRKISELSLHMDLRKKEKNKEMLRE